MKQDGNSIYWALSNHTILVRKCTTLAVDCDCYWLIGQQAKPSGGSRIWYWCPIIRRDNSELQRPAPVESSHLTVYLPGLSTASAFVGLNIRLFRSADLTTSRRTRPVSITSVSNNAGLSAKLLQCISTWSWCFACLFKACHRRGQDSAGMGDCEMFCSVGRQITIYVRSAFVCVDI